MIIWSASYRKNPPKSKRLTSAQSHGKSQPIENMSNTMLGVSVCMPVMQKDALKNGTPLRPHIDLSFKTLNNLVLSLIHPLALDLEFSYLSAGHSGSS